MFGIKNDEDANNFVWGRRVATVSVAILDCRVLSKVHIKQKLLDQI